MPLPPLFDPRTRGTLECEVCKRSFAREANYNRHIAICNTVQTRSSSFWQRSTAPSRTTTPGGANKRAHAELDASGSTTKFGVRYHYSFMWTKMYLICLPW